MNGAARYTRREQPRDEFIRETPQLFRADRAGDHHIGHTVAPDTTPDHRIFGIFWQCGNRIHRRLHIRRGAGHVPIGLELERDGPAALARGSGGAFDPFDRQQDRFKHLNDGTVHIVGPRPLPNGSDRHTVDDHIRKELRPHIRRSGRPADQQHHKQQVGCRPVTGEIRQDSPCTTGHAARHLPSLPSGFQGVRSCAPAPAARPAAPARVPSPLGACGCSPR